MKILLTTTSFQDTPGKHHDLLKDTGFEVDTLRGPVAQEVLFPIIANYDGIICGDDDLTNDVIRKGKEGKLKVISKYGVGLDKIDLDAAKKHEIPVFNTPGVNQITVAEHTLALMLSYLKNIYQEYNYTKNGSWKRLTGNELFGKKVGILGLGKIGKELAKRLSVFGVELFAFDTIYDDAFLNKYDIQRTSSVSNLIFNIDILSINIPLLKETKHIINKDIINEIINPLIIVNTSRAMILDQQALMEGLKTSKIKAYLTDVMDEEPMQADHPLLEFENVLITSHIGSRTFENVERQGKMAVQNLFSYFSKNTLTSK